MNGSEERAGRHSNKKIAAAGVVAVLAVGLYVVLHRTPAAAPPPPSPQPAAAPSPRPAAPLPSPLPSYEEAMSTHIDLWAKVIDQDGQPVPEATIQYYSDAPHQPKTVEGQSGYFIKTDADGNFEVHGIQGGSLVVMSSKAGYGTVPDRSTGVFSEKTLEYGLAADKGRPYADPAHRVVFTLEKLGTPEPLTHVQRGWQPLVPNGPWLRVAIGSNPNLHFVDFSLKVDKDAATLGGSKKRYAWDAAIRVPHGGLVGHDALGFTAPEKGYQTQVICGYPNPQPGDEWRGTVGQQDFFIRFEDGTFGRIFFDVTGDDREDTLILETWYNPVSGSRQLAPGLGKPERRKGVQMPQLPKR